MIAAIAAAFEADALACGLREDADHLRGDGLGAGVIEHGLRPFGVGLGLIADGLEAVDAVFQRRVVQIGHASLDGVIESFEAQFRFGATLVQFGDMLAAPLGMFLPAVERGGKNHFQPLGLEQLLLKVIGHQIVQLVHRHGHALAGGRPLPRLHRAGVIAIASSLAGADGHGPAAPGAMDQPRQHGRAADDAGGHDLGIARLQERLHRVERLPVDDRRHRNRDDLADGFQLLGLGPFVELMLAHIGVPGQDAVDLPDAPAPAVSGEDAAAVEIGDDILDAHLAGDAIAFQGKAIDQPHRIGVQRVDFQLLLDLGTALLGRDDAVADRGKRAVPEALTGILLQGPHDVLCVFLGLVFVEQRHDLPHHDVHGVIPHFLRDRNQLHAVLRQLADIELKLEVIAEEAAERVNHYHVERRGLGRSRLDHALELRAVVVVGGCAWLHIGFDKLVATRGAIGFALPLLVGDRHVMLGLPCRRNPQVKGSA